VSLLLVARRLTLYLLSLLTAASAHIAWVGPRPAFLFGLAVGLAFGVVLGELLADVLSGFGASGWRRRSRRFLFGGYAIVAFGALTLATADYRFAARATEALGLLHIALLLAGEFFGLRLAILANALALMVLAGLAGKFPAVLAVTGTVGLLPFCLTFDHLSRRLRALPSVPAAVLTTEASETARIVLPILAVLVAYFCWAPPPPLAAPGFAGAAVTSAETREAYRWLTLVALAGGACLTMLVRLLRRGGGDSAMLVEDADTLVLAEESLGPEGLDEARYGPGRGRVIRAYVGFVAHARAAGFKLEAWLTPREIERRALAAGAALGRLTTAFMDARYGPDEPSDADIRAAEGAAREVKTALTRRRGASAHRSRTGGLHT